MVQKYSWLNFPIEYFSNIEFSPLWLLTSDAVYFWCSSTDVTFDNLLGHPLQIQYCLFPALFYVCVSPQEKHSSFIREARKAKKKKKSVKATWNKPVKAEHILFNFMSALLIKFYEGVMVLKTVWNKMSLLVWSIEEKKKKTSTIQSKSCVNMAQASTHAHTHCRNSGREMSYADKGKVKLWKTNLLDYGSCGWMRGGGFWLPQILCVCMHLCASKCGCTDFPTTGYTWSTVKENQKLGFLSKGKFLMLSYWRVY